MEREDGHTRNSTEYILDNIANGLKQGDAVDASAESRGTSNRFGGDVDMQGRRPWFRMLEGYTSRNMTYQSDKLPALSGVLFALQELTNDVCYAGIWKSWFLKGLLWRLQVPDRDRYVFTPKEAKKPEMWRSPSWSFASLEGVVLYNLLENDPGRDLCAILEECSVVPKGLNPLGEVKSGFARITAPLTKLDSVQEELIDPGKPCMIHMAKGVLAEGDVYFDTETHESCDVLMITPHTGIAVKSVESTVHSYVRIGAVSVHRVYSGTSASETPASENRDGFLSASDYPESSSVLLL